MTETLTENRAAKMGCSSRMVRRRASTCVVWIMRYAGSGTCDVIRRNAAGNIEWSVRLSGSVVDSDRAKEIALAYRAGNGSPPWVQSVTTNV